MQFPQLVSIKVITAAILIIGLSCGAAGARGSHSSSRVYYGGGHHTYSHGGSYAGSVGSSHRGGHYRNLRSGNNYGRHK